MYDKYHNDNKNLDENMINCRQFLKYHQKKMMT